MAVHEALDNADWLPFEAGRNGPSVSWGSIDEAMMSLRLGRRPLVSMATGMASETEGKQRGW